MQKNLYLNEILHISNSQLQNMICNLFAKNENYLNSLNFITN